MAYLAAALIYTVTKYVRSLYNICASMGLLITEHVKVHIS